MHIGCASSSPQPCAIVDNVLIKNTPHPHVHHIPHIRARARTHTLISSLQHLLHGTENLKWNSSFSPTPARGNANGISKFIKQKEKRGCYCARCLCTRHIKAAVSAVEREIKEMSQGRRSTSSEAKGGEPGETASRQWSTM